MWLFGCLSAMVFSYVAYCWRAYYLTPELVIEESIPQTISPALREYYLDSDFSNSPTLKAGQAWYLLVHPFSKSEFASASMNKKGAVVLDVPWQSKSVLLRCEGDWHASNIRQIPSF